MVKCGQSVITHVVNPKSMPRQVRERAYRKRKNAWHWKSRPNYYEARVGPIFYDRLAQRLYVD